MSKTYRPASATIAVVGAGLLGAFLLGDAFVRGGVVQGLLLAPWVLLAVWLIYTLLYAPYVATDERAIAIANPLRVTRVPWPAVSDIRLRWQVTVDTVDGRSIAAFGGPSPSRPARVGRGAWSSVREEAAKMPTAVREIEEIRAAWDENASEAPAEPITRSWNRAVLIPLAVIVVWAAIALVFGG
ncbi:PH domain-containing protein [Microbacterium sp. F1-18]